MLLRSHKKNGFFVEVGAHNGLSMTNTLFEEVERNVRKSVPPF